MFPGKWDLEISCEEGADSSELQAGLKLIKKETTNFEPIA